MGERINQDTVAVISAIVSCDNPQSIMSPEDFTDKAIEVIEVGIKIIQPVSYSSQHPKCSCEHLSCSCQHPTGNCQHPTCNCQHPSSRCLKQGCSCTDVTTCSQSMLLSVLSALDVIFEICEDRNINTATESDISSCNKSIETTFPCSSYFKQSDAKKSMEKWYFDTAKLLSSSDVTDLLVKCLVCWEKFTSFLARKVLISGMNTSLIQISQVLNIIKQQCLTSVEVCVPVLEILRDMMSRKKFKTKNIPTTFSLLKEMELNSFIGARFCESSNRFINTSGLLEYLSLLRKVVKHTVYTQDKLGNQEVTFVFTVIETCLQFGDYFFTISRIDKGHLICLEYIKAINTLLDIRFIECKSTFVGKLCKISKDLQTRVHKYLKMTGNCDLLSGINFIGARISSDSQNKITFISSLERQIILIVLKSSAFAVKEKSNSVANIEHNLKCSWNEIRTSVNESKQPHTEDWLPIVFADQDDQWITALICLLIIHKELKKRHIENQDLMSISGKTIENQKLSAPSLQELICPHKLFLQLVKFISYDHLVLTDFLTSPETPFLFYFTQYLHVLIEDWQGFLSACVNDIQVDSLKSIDARDIENCASDKDSGSKSGASTKGSLFLSRLLAVKNSHFGDLSQNCCETSQVLAESSGMHTGQLFPEFFKEAITAPGDPLQRLKHVSTDHIYTSEPQSNQQPSSLTHSSYMPQLLPKVDHSVQSSAVTFSEPYVCETPRPVLCLVVPASSAGNHSDTSNNILTEYSVNQCSDKQKHYIPQCHEEETTFEMQCRATNGSSKTLVAYSDSDSETSLTETGADVTESMEEHIYTSEYDICEVGSTVDTNDSCLSEPSFDSEEDILSHHESATHSKLDQNVYCNDKVDVVMGMMIRLRLHVERLDHSKLFPYKAKSLLRLLEICEELYERPNGL